MKGWVYIVRSALAWQAQVSIEIEVDIRYWLDDAFRVGVAAAGEGVLQKAGDVLLYWAAPLPLGQAFEAAAKWQQGVRKRLAAGRQGWQGDERRAGQRLTACVREVVGRTDKETPGREVDLRAYAGGSGAVASVSGLAEGGQGMRIGMPGNPDNGQVAWPGGERALERVMGVRGSGRRESDSVPGVQGSVQRMSDSGSGAWGRGQEAQGDVQRMRSSGTGVRSSEQREQDSSLGARATGERAPLLTRVRPFASRAPAAARAQGHALAAAAGAAARALQGRALLRREAHDLLAGAGAASPEAASWSASLQLAALLGRLRLSSAVAADNVPRRLWALGRLRRRARCQRCGSGEARLRRTPCGSCGRMCAYCEACLTMGKARECELLVRGGHAPMQRVGGAALEAPLEVRLQRWGLSPAQQAAATQALQYIEQPSAASPDAEERNFLLWAVTGAGKTEMIFPLIDSVLQRGGRALVATPRRDVVLELDPRIRRAFPEASVVTLYGGSEQRWEQGQITLATTHQLMRFAEAFDLVVVDEIDAFPYTTKSI